MALPGAPDRFSDPQRVRAALPPPLPSLKPPSEHVRLSWRGLSAAVPMSLVTAVATALITHWASPAGLPADDSLRSQVRDIAADVRDLKALQREARTQLSEEMAFTSRDIPLLASVIEHGCSAKFAWHDGLRPAEPDWLPPPLGGVSPQWQPAVAMLPAPKP